MDQRPANPLSPKQHEAIMALLSETSVPRAAEKCGVGKRTLYRWLDEPDFAAAYRRARREAFGQAIGLVQRYATSAVNVMARIMTDSNMPPNARVSAASAVLKFGREGIELDDLAARVDALERSADKDHLNQTGGQRPWRYHGA